MKKLLPILVVPLFAGCLTSRPPTVAAWDVTATASTETAAAPSFGVTRFSALGVRAPYDVRAIAVRRADRSLAFDPYNNFAAVPSQLLKGVTLDVLDASGRFQNVVSGSSAAAVSHIVEVSVDEFLLDCSGFSDETPHREAVARVTVFVLDRDRKIVMKTRATGVADATERDFGFAFSLAYTKALGKALAEPDR